MTTAVLPIASLPLMILRNSGNSISYVPSLSTILIIFLTSSLVSTIPREINGSSNSSTPIFPEPSASSDLKYYLSFYLS